MTWTVTISSWHPTPLNKLLRGRWQAHRAKAASRDVVFYAFRVLPKRVIHRARGKRRVTLTIVLGKGQRGCDPDAYWKDCLDALVACGMLRDDNRHGVELAPVQFERSDKPATRITLEDIA